MVFLMRPRIMALPFGAYMLFILCPKSRAETSTFTFWGGRNGWSYNSETMFQWGVFGPNGMRAWATTHDTAYTFRSAALHPQIGATAGVASGNRGGSASP